jgi:hypothetical protein
MESDDSSSDEEENKTLAQLAKTPKATDVQPSSSASSKDEEEEAGERVAFSDNVGNMEKF